MSQVPVVSNSSVENARAMPPMTWNGTMVGPAETATHYLHLSAFPCEKCSGPVVAGWLGTRHDDISQETDIRKVGAACIACGDIPEVIIESSVDHQFRPVQWKWAIKLQPQPAASNTAPLREGLSQNAEFKP
jgi:hypothetical protein